MAIDNEFAFVFAHKMNNQFWNALEHSNNLLDIRWIEEFASSHGFVIEAWGEDEYFLYPAGTTRKRPAGIIVSRVSAGELMSLKGARFVAATGGITFAVMENGFVRLGKPSKEAAVRRAQKSPALH